MVKNYSKIIKKLFENNKILTSIFNDSKDYFLEYIIVFSFINDH